MKDFTDVTPTEKKREKKIQKEKKLEHETRERKKKKEPKKATEEKPRETAVTEAPAEPMPAAEAPAEQAPVKEAAKKPKEKKRKAIPVEKIQYHAKKDVPGKGLRKKKPRFRRQEHYKKRLDLVWRKPIGIDSKQHEGKRGKGKKPNIGYKNPDAIRGLHPLGYRPVLVHNVRELGLVNPQTEAAVIASAVGRRKRNEVIKEANRLKITILNPRKGEL